MSARAYGEIRRIEKLMSFHDPGSELSTVNRLAWKRPVTIGPDLHRVLSFGLDLSRWTGGVYDLTVAPWLIKEGRLPQPLGGSVDPAATWRDVRLDHDRVELHRRLLIDLGGIAKGYAVDRAMALLPADVEAVVDAGGDLAMRPWQGKTVGLRVPGSRRGRVIKTPMLGPAVASSATGKGCAIVCTDRGATLKNPRGVSVFADHCMTADALTKIALLAPDALEPRRRAGARALEIRRRGFAPVRSVLKGRTEVLPIWDS